MCQTKPNTCPYLCAAFLWGYLDLYPCTSCGCLSSGNDIVSEDQPVICSPGRVSSHSPVASRVLCGADGGIDSGTSPPQMSHSVNVTQMLPFVPETAPPSIRIYRWQIPLPFYCQRKEFQCDFLMYKWVMLCSWECFPYDIYFISLYFCLFFFLYWFNVKMYRDVSRKRSPVMWWLLLLLFYIWVRLLLLRMHPL